MCPHAAGPEEYLHGGTASFPQEMTSPVTGTHCKAETHMYHFTIPTPCYTPVSCFMCTCCSGMLYRAAGGFTRQTSRGKCLAAGQHWQQSSLECEQLLVYRAPVMPGTGGFDRDKNTIYKALRRDNLCISLGMTKGAHMHMHEWTCEPIKQRPAISQGDSLAGWATED